VDGSSPAIRGAVTDRVEAKGVAQVRVAFEEPDRFDLLFELALVVEDVQAVARSTT
jgi:hypothetical protein